MDRLKLHVNQSGFNQQRQILPVLMQEPLEGAHALDHELGRGRDNAALPERVPPIQF